MFHELRVHRPTTPSSFHKSVKTLYIRIKLESFYCSFQCSNFYNEIRLVIQCRHIILFLYHAHPLHAYIPVFYLQSVYIDTTHSATQVERLFLQRLIWVLLYNSYKQWFSNGVCLPLGVREGIPMDARI